MASIILPRTELTQQLRLDTISAYNVLRRRGMVPPDGHYAFARKRGGEWGVELWKGPRHAPTGGVAWCSCVDLIVAAGPLPVVRGAASWD